MKSIIFFGDSNTWGYIPGAGTRHAYDVRYPGKLQKMLGEEYLIYEEGLVGRTLTTRDGLLPYACGMDYVNVTLMVNAPADMVVIMLGTNDTKPHLAQTSASIAKGMEKMVQAVKRPEFGKNGSAPTVVVVSPIAVGANVGEVKNLRYYFDQSSIEKQKMFAELYREVANEQGCLFMDASLYAQPSTVDAIHMDEEGHDGLAHAFYSLITDYYK